MKASNPTSLWIRIENFDIDGCRAQNPFESRLAHEQRWSRRFAKRAIEEYKRFVFLAMVAGHPVTPSKVVDEVWHLHLTYTRSYWDRMVKDILPRPLHHEPSKGGRSEVSRHASQYVQTLEAYVRYFGTPPPADIWPSGLISRPDIRRRRTSMAAVTVAAAAILGGCAPIVAQGSTTIALWVVGGLVGLGGLGFLLHQMVSGRGDETGMGTGTMDPSDPRHRQEGAYGACSVATTTIPFDERIENQSDSQASEATGDGTDSGSDSGSSDGGSDGGCGSGCSS